eukprot:306825_1
MNPTTYGCKICNIQCNSETQLQKHKNGKKHNIKATKSQTLSLHNIHNNTNNTGDDTKTTTHNHKSTSESSSLTAPMTNTSQNNTHNGASVSLFENKKYDKCDTLTIHPLNTQIPHNTSHSPASPISPASTVSPPPVSVPPLSIQPNNTLIIFDFDDTFFPTHMVKSYIIGQLPLPPNVATTLESLGNKVLNLFNQLGTEYGFNNIKIVSNGSLPWICFALNYAALYSPSYSKIKALLFAEKINCHSAYDGFTNQFPMQPYMWKRQMYRYLFKIHNVKKNYQNIITIGDQVLDHTAAMTALNDYGIDYGRHNCKSHSIKLKENPLYNDMTNQIDYIVFVFNNINGLMGNLDGEIRLLYANEL